MISFISSFTIINAVIPDLKMFFWIAASAADAINPKCIKTLLADGLSTFLIKGKPRFSTGPKSLPKNLPDYPISSNWVFNNFILTEEPFTKALWSLKTCILANNNLCGKLVSPLESLTIFDESFKLLQYHFLFQILIYQIVN